MGVLFTSENFIVSIPEKPHVDRLDGGHIKIEPKVPIENRTQLSPELAKELMKLTMIVGEAMDIGLNRRGIDVGRINYQDNGNWRPQMHIHLYGRAKSAKKQLWGEALYLPKPPKGFYEGLEPLNTDDAKEIQKEINRLLFTEKYKNF